MISRKLLTMVISAGIVVSAVVNVNAAPQSQRLWGLDRYETCSSIVNQGWTSTSYYAVIVNGENFPDALSAAPLAEKYNAPILLTQDDTLNSNTVNELKRLNVKNVIIVGGEGVVKPVVESAINKLGIQTSRYRGQDRDETALKVASQIGTKNGIIVAVNSDYADALSAAPIAAREQMPIILVSKDTYNFGLQSFIQMNNIPKTYVLGDSNVISDRVASIFPNVQRITGNNKYERNINIINTFKDKLNFNNLYLAYSEQFADALSGSVLAANNYNPVILVGNEISDVTNNFVKNNLNSVNNIIALGGHAVIKDSLVNGLISGTAQNPDDTNVDLYENEGNTPRNLLNGGFIVEKNGWIYYVKNGDKVCKIKTDGTQERVLSVAKNPRSINVVEDTIYYVGDTSNSSINNSYTGAVSIFKGYTDNTSFNSLVTKREENYGQEYPYMQVEGNSVCYSPNFRFISRENANYYEEFHKLSVDTNEDKISSGEYFKSMIVKNGYVYFSTLYNDEIRKMPISGNKKKDGTIDNKEINFGIKGTVLDVVNDYIYYTDTNGDNYRIKEDGSNKTKVANITDKFIIHGDWIYYILKDSDNLGQLHKMKFDGTQDVGLDAYKVSSFAITGDWIYYRISGNGNIYRLQLDGTRKEEFPDKIGVKSIDDIDVSVKKGDSYKLPVVIRGIMGDDSTQYFGVTWDKKDIDTNTVGIYKFSGTVNGYNKKVTLSVRVY
ncbi:cell wall-binding repeat-containing protein [Clostridium scatologenes]|uniref:Ig domain protein n=1 Tax=Clostridium scatologenes TaxID=1548 RepID=A0A0E3MAP2_CLOSL|nr:cell wall-binding repeat-containing protein [Clostridium scatologenes]AKA70840.1 Ig domain protein [Clostridium scatologenes]